MLWGGQFMLRNAHIPIRNVRVPKHKLIKPELQMKIINQKKENIIQMIRFNIQELRDSFPKVGKNQPVVLLIANQKLKIAFRVAA